MAVVNNTILIRKHSFGLASCAGTKVSLHTESVYVLDNHLNLRNCAVNKFHIMYIDVT